ALYAALNFLVTGLALLILDVKSRSGQHPSSYLIIIVGLTGLTAVIGYIYGASEFIGASPYTPLALDATFGFLLLFIGVLLARPTAATVVLVAGGYPGSLFIRFLIPGLIVLVILTGWLRLNGENRGYYSTELGVALFSLIIIAVATTLIFMAAMRLYTVERRRSRAELEIRELNANLEQQVTKRTGDLRRSEEKYRTIFENATEGIFQSTPQGKYISVNPAFARVGGFSSPDEMINSVANIQKELYVNPEDRTRLIELLASQDTVNGYEFEIKRHDGTRSWVSINVRAVRDPAGKIIYLEGTLVDIAERKRAELELKQSSERYRDLFENSGAAITIIDENGRYLMANNKVAASFGRTPEEFVGRSIYDFVPREIADRYMQSNRRLLRTGEQREYEDTLVLPTGVRSFLFVDTCLKDENGRCFAIQSSSIDITDRKQAEQALRESEEKYRSLFNNAELGMYRSKIDGSGVLEVNEKLCKIIGYSRDEILSDPTAIRWASARVFYEMRQSVIERGVVTDYEFDLINKNGEIRTCLGSTKYYPQEGYFEGSVEDITERKQAEQALRESEEKFRNVFDYSAIGKSITTLDGKVNPNQALADMLGYPRDELSQV
ncbi:MAG: PAS domain S-box protein, partial [Chloroflexi bacterium]|nr:PAS domain S-box protein [Chloroflexota bacterium]